MALFERVFGLEHEPVKSVKIKVETSSGLAHPHKTANPTHNVKRGILAAFAIMIAG